MPHRFIQEDKERYYLGMCEFDTCPGLSPSHTHFSREWVKQVGKGKGKGNHSLALSDIVPEFDRQYALTLQQPEKPQSTEYTQMFEGVVQGSPLP